MAEPIHLETIEQAQEQATERLWTYNNERSSMVIGRITPFLGESSAMAVSKIKVLLFLGAALFLGACSQSISTSSVFVDEKFLTDQLRNNLVEDVYKKADQFGANAD